jgi:hypothetical protein
MVLDGSDLGGFSSPAISIGLAARQAWPSQSWQGSEVVGIAVAQPSPGGRQAMREGPDEQAVVLTRRPIDNLLAEAGSRLDRVEREDLAAEQAAGRW